MIDNLDSLPELWQVQKIGDFAETMSGGTPSRERPEYFMGQILWVKSGELTDNLIVDTGEKITRLAVQNSSAKVFPAGTLLIAMYGATVGKTAILAAPAATNQAVCAIFPEPSSISIEYLRYALVNLRPQLLQKRYGGAQPNISQTIIRNQEVVLPPLEEQRKIAYVLGTVQRAIEQQTQLIERTQELKRALMHKLFTEGTRGEPQKETEIGPVPESWSVVQLRRVAPLVQYGTSVKCDYDVDGVPVLRIPNVVNGTIDIADLKLGVPTSNQMESLKLEYGDLLFVRTNGVKENAGRSAIFAGELEPCYFASYLIRVRLSGEMDPEFVNYYTQTQLGMSFLSGRSIRTADGKFNINSGILKSCLLPKPSLEEQQTIASMIDTVQKKIDVHKAKHDCLRGLFDALLHKLMTAQIRVHDLALPLPA